MREFREFNVNHYVYVRITEQGWKVLEDYFRALDFPPIAREQAYYAPDEHGWSRFQMWDLMNIFGPSMGMGFGPVPFETTIRLQDA
jgi:hypothetical protein